MRARNSLLRDTSQVHRGTLPRVASSDEDIREAKVSADIVALETALHYRAAGHDGGIIIDAHNLVAIADRFIGGGVCLDAVQVFRLVGYEARRIRQHEFIR